MDTQELYKNRIETFRFYVTYGQRMIFLYLLVIAALAKFGLDSNSTPQLFYTLMGSGTVYCIWVIWILRLHYFSAKNLRDSINKLAVDLKIQTHQEDGDRFCRYINSLKVFNLVVLASFIVSAVIGPGILLLNNH